MGEYDLKAKKNISKYLEGHDDIVYYASWMDYMGYVTKSGYSNEWFDHCVPVNKDFEYAEGDFPGDALMAIEKAIERLGDGKYRNLDDSTVLLLIKHLVHFLPDMHCPAHVIYNYRPSNYWVEINGRKELFHSVWDNMPSYGPHAWSVSSGAGTGTLHRRSGPSWSRVRQGSGSPTMPATASSLTTSSVPMRMYPIRTGIGAICWPSSNCRREASAWLMC
ncbi:MAG: S1/P1 nuclease [Alistipes sp.]